MDSALCYGLCTHGAWCQGMYLVCAARAVCPWCQGLCIRGVPCQRLYVHSVWCQEMYIHDVWCQGFMSMAPEAACSWCGVPGNVHPWCVVPGLCAHGNWCWGVHAQCLVPRAVFTPPPRSSGPPGTLREHCLRRDAGDQDSLV